MPESSPVKNVKIMLTGESGVGKSSLIQRFVGSDFDADIVSTIGTDSRFTQRVIDGNRVKLAIWDITGQEKFRAVAKSMYRKAQGLICVYDVTSRDTFEKLCSWVQEVDNNCEDSIKMIVANKIDLPNRVVTRHEGWKFAKKHNALFIESSAKTMENVDSTFEDLVEKIVKTGIPCEKQQERVHLEEPRRPRLPMPESSPVKNVKIMLTGESGVGKTSLIQRFVGSDFNARLIATVGADSRFTQRAIDGNRVKLAIWDTAGQEKYRAVTKSIYRGAHGVICVYDVTKRDTFEKLNYWMQEVHNHCDDGITIMIVANKIDLPNRKVTRHEGWKFARNHGTLFTETSAKTKEKVDSTFEGLVEKIVKTGIPCEEQQERVYLEDPRSSGSSGLCGGCSGRTQMNNNMSNNNIGSISINIQPKLI